MISFYNNTLHYTILYYSTVHYGTVQYSTLLCTAILSSSASQLKISFPTGSGTYHIMRIRGT